MQKKLKKQIYDLIKETPCKKNFICVESNFEQLCKAVDIGLENYLECREKKPWHCNLSSSTEKFCFCSCPIRKLIYKNLNK